MDPPRRIKLRVPAFSSDGNVEVFEAFIGFELGVVEVAHTEVVISKTLGGGDFADCWVKWRNS